MPRKRVIIPAALSALVVAAGGVGVAAATGGDDGGNDPEAPISGPALDRASDAAIEHVGGGRVTDTEVGDEESYYEVEVTRRDGRQVDVQLDRDFEVVGDEVDSETHTGGDD
jgi:uncharacterized membrane protein YkoI